MAQVVAGAQQRRQQPQQNFDDSGDGLTARTDDLNDSVNSSVDLSSSSWIISDSAYDGTGLRVRSHTEDSIAALFSEHDGEDAEDDRSSSDGDSSEVTAMAVRPAAASISVEMDRDAPSEQSNSSYSAEDMITPSLATANLSGMQFGQTPSPEPPLTLASYLASTLSSPKTRSQSSSSLASFPTDLMSDISRSESAVDTDDAASEVNSDPGEPGHPMAVRMHRSNNDLVMPKLRPASTPSGASSDRTSSSDRQAPLESMDGSTKRDEGDLRVLIVGGTDVEQKQLRRRLLRKYRHRDPMILQSTTSKQAGPRQGNPGSSGSVLLPDRLVPPTIDNNFAFSSVYTSLKSCLQVETSPNLGSAIDRTLRPFQALESVLRPESQAPEDKLVDDLLPSLLGKVAGIDACLLFLKPDKGVTLAQHVSSHYNGLRKLSKLTTLMPVLQEVDGSGEVDAASQLTQGDIEFWGLSSSGTLLSLRKGGKPVYFPISKSDRSHCVSALHGSSLRQRSASAYRRWTACEAAQRVKATPPATLTSRPSSSASESHLRNGSEQTDSQEALSLTSSLVESLTLPPTSRNSNESSTEALASQVQHSSLPTASPKCVNQPCFDPLHLPSLIRLVGLGLANAFGTLRSDMASLFMPWRLDPADSEDEQEQLDESATVESHEPHTSASGMSAVAKDPEDGRAAEVNDGTSGSRPIFGIGGLFIVSVLLGATVLSW